jgi:hypothetical protein
MIAMEALALLIVLLFIGLIIYSVSAINKFSEDKYNYDPFNLINLSIILIPSLICFFWIGFEQFGDHIINYKDLNHIVLYIFLSGACIIVVAIIFSNTHNIIIAIYSTIIMLIGAMLIAGILLLMVLKVVSQFSEKKK